MGREILEVALLIFERAEMWDGLTVMPISQAARRRVFRGTDKLNSFCFLMFEFQGLPS